MHGSVAVNQQKVNVINLSTSRSRRLISLICRSAQLKRVDRFTEGWYYFSIGFYHGHLVGARDDDGNEANTIDDDDDDDE